MITGEERKPTDTEILERICSVLLPALGTDKVRKV
jgi:hypothetical protein